MLYASRPNGPVSAAQKCSTHGPLSGVARGGDVRRGGLCGGSTGGCRRGVELSRRGPTVRHWPSHGEEDAELGGASGLPPDNAGQAAQAGRVHRHHRRDPGGRHGSERAAQAAAHGTRDHPATSAILLAMRLAADLTGSVARWA